MKVAQISVFLENKSGRLADVAKTLGSNKVNIRALSIADTSDFGILRLIVDNPEKASESLKEEGFTVSQTDVVAVHIPDHPGGLGTVLSVLEDSMINIEYMYAFVTKSEENAVVVFKVEQLEAAIEALTSNGIKLMQGSEIYGI